MWHMQYISFSPETDDLAASFHNTCTQFHILCKYVCVRVGMFDNNICFLTREENEDIEEDVELIFDIVCTVHRNLL